MGPGIAQNRHRGSDADISAIEAHIEPQEFSRLLDQHWLVSSKRARNANDQIDDRPTCRQRAESLIERRINRHEDPSEEAHNARKPQPLEVGGEFLFSNLFGSHRWFYARGHRLRSQKFPEIYPAIKVFSAENLK